MHRAGRMERKGGAGREERKRQKEAERELTGGVLDSGTLIPCARSRDDGRDHGTTEALTIAGA